MEAPSTSTASIADTPALKARAKTHLINVTASAPGAQPLALVSTY
jgi:hypothetical protein